MSWDLKNVELMLDPPASQLCVCVCVCVCSAEAPGGAVVHWSRWRSLLILIMATLLMSACADLATQHIQPILHQPNISQVDTTNTAALRCM